MLIAMRFAACAAFVCAAVGGAFAQSTEPAPSPQPSEIGRVVTADRQDEPITMSTRPTFIVSRRQIDDMGARTVGAALQFVPGVSLFSYGPYGSLTNYGLLGATSAQTLVLLNGFPVSAGSTGSVDLGNFSTAGVDRIEVVEGGGSTLYGSSAVGGIINIITGAPRGVDAAVSAGTLGNRDARVDLGFGSLGVAYERHIATNSYDYPSLDGFPAGTRTNAQAAGSAARLDFRTALTPALSIDAALGDQALTNGVPGNLGFLTPAAMQGNARSDAHVTLTHHGQNSALSLSFSGARSAFSYNDPQNGGETDTYDSRTQVSLRSVAGSDRSSLVSGIDLARESALLFLGAASVPPTATAALSQSAAYAQYRAAVGGRTIVNVGLRGEHDSPQGSVLVPAAGVSFGAAMRLSLNYAQTFRVPTIDDLYFPGFSNPNLVPERAQNLDATLRVPLGSASASLDWFSRQAVNLIALDQNFVPQNIARASLSGFVFTARTAPFHGLVATAGITDMYRALNLSPGAVAMRLDFQPVTRTLLGLERPFGAGRTAFGINANVESPHNEGGVARGGQTTIDAYVRERLARDLVISLRARNLGDERYAPILGYPAPGRTIEVELATK